MRNPPLPVDPVRSLLPCTLLLLLVTSLLVPTGVAQFADSDAVVHQGDDGAVILEDETGDPGPLGLGVEDNPAVSAAYSHVDIAALTIGPEEADRLHMTLAMAPQNAVGSTPGEAVALQDRSCSIVWSYENSDDLRMSIGFGEDNLRLPGAPREDPAYAQMYYDYYDGDDWGWGWWDDGFTIEYDAEANAYRFTILKHYMPTIPEIRPPMAGDAMTAISADCRTDVALYGRISDYVDGGDARFSFRDVGQGEMLNVRFADEPDRSASGAEEDVDWEAPPEDALQLSVPPGQQSAIPVRLENRANGQRVVVPTARLLDDVGAGWNLTLPSTILLRGGETRTVNLFITPPADTTLGTQLRVEVGAGYTGGPMLGHSVRTLVVEPGLGADHDTIHFHSDAPDEGANANLEQVRLHTNLIQDDPRFNDGPISLLATASRWFTTSISPGTAPVVLDTDEPARGQVLFESDGPTEAGIRITVSADDVGTIAHLDAEVPTNTPYAFELPLSVGDDENRIPAGTPLQLDVRMRGVPEGGGAAAEVRFMPAESWLTVPARTLRQETVVTDGRYLPNLKVAEDEEPYVYVNPGNQYAFDLVLANDGQQTDDLTVQTEPTGDADGWTIEVLPGRSYRVQPGNGTPVTVRAVAPPDANEGDKVEINVTAVSKHDDVARSTVQLTLVVTQGVPIEEKAYEEKEGQFAPLSEAEESPLVTPMVALLMAALAVGLARRRHA